MAVLEEAGRPPHVCRTTTAKPRLVHFKKYGRSPWKPRGRKTGIFRILKQAGVPEVHSRGWMEDRIEVTEVNYK